MATAYVIYNDKAGDTDSLSSVKKLEGIIKDEIKYINVQSITDYRVFLQGIENCDYVILAGGDGTLNRFINNIDGIEFKCDLKYYPNGTGNDFAHDLGHQKECEPFSIKKYFNNLPTVCVNGESFRFINGVGYGIDGYCCEVGEEIKKAGQKKVNYTGIAIKGVLFHYKPRNAKITVDGKEYIFKKVWLAPTMNGRFYGGGMMPTPSQKRNSGKVSVMVFHACGTLKGLMIFPSLFKGEHIKYKKNIEIIEGDEIKIEFDRPTPLQIDGETILGVTSYSTKAGQEAKIVI